MMKFLPVLLCIVASSTAFTTPSCAVSSGRSSAAPLSNANHLHELQSPRFIKTTTSLEARLNGEDEKVNVVEMEVDAFTLTAVGFGLIAFNFLVLANVSTQTMFLLFMLFINSSIEKKRS